MNRMTEHTTLLAYALNALEDDANRAIEARLKSSAELRQALAHLQHRLFEQTESRCEQPAASLKQRLLESIGASNPFACFAIRVAAFLDLTVADTSNMLDQLADSEHPKWQQSPTLGVRTLPLEAGARLSGAHCLAMELMPGATLPAHRHAANEWGFVLQGTIRENELRQYDAGDMVCKPEGSEHAFTALGPNRGLLIVVLEGPVKFLENPNTL
ncbi:MAG: hypothetical protein DHS20C11_28810 [Lysobacteraceae bacterium]|nr:MAG: hypothetical protein DHS20C11_28810 [Xanthomonadaceae bacterium]